MVKDGGEGRVMVEGSIVYLISFSHGPLAKQGDVGRVPLFM